MFKLYEDYKNEDRNFDMKMEEWSAPKDDFFETDFSCLHQEERDIDMEELARFERSIGS